MPRCKPGDLAVVVCSDFAEWIGALVTVVRVSREWGIPGRLVWSVQPHSAAGKRVLMGEDLYVAWNGRNTVAIPDNCLRPIRPGELEDDVTRDEVIEA